MKNGKVDVGEMHTTNVTKVEEGSDEDIYSTLVAANEFVESWILDSGCTYYLCPHDDPFHSFLSSIGAISMVNSAPCKVSGASMVKILIFNGAIIVLDNVQHVPELRQDLISIRYLEANGCMFKAMNGVLKFCKGVFIAM